MALLGVGSNMMSLNDLCNLIDNPNENLPKHVEKVAPCGLYLINIEYPPHAFLPHVEHEQNQVMYNYDRIDRILNSIDKY